MAATAIQRWMSLITKGLTELDTTVRNGYVEEVQTIVAGDLPSMPIYHPTWNLAMLEGSHGIFLLSRYAAAICSIVRRVNLVI